MSEGGIAVAEHGMVVSEQNVRVGVLGIDGQPLIAHRDRTFEERARPTPSPGGEVVGPGQVSVRNEVGIVEGDGPLVGLHRFVETPQTEIGASEVRDRLVCRADRDGVFQRRDRFFVAPHRDVDAAQAREGRGVAGREGDRLLALLRRFGIARAAEAEGAEHAG